MRFPHSFQRRVGGDGPIPELGTADPPPTWDSPGPLAKDNYFTVTATTAGGYALAGFILAFSGPAETMDVDLYSYESTTASWVKLCETQTVTRGELTRADAQVPTELIGIDVLMVPVPAGGEADGIYTFAISGTHTP